MKVDEAKTAVKALTELTDYQKEIYNTVRGMNRQVTATRKLWREGNKSRLIQLGMAIMVFPEPTPVTPTIGACLVAVGAIQRGIQNRYLYMEDVMKTFHGTLREIYASKYDLHI